MSIRHLVIDTNYVLNRVEGFNAENVYATPDVIAEIRDEQSVQYLQTLNYFQKITVRAPSAESLKRISEACIAIGELGSLSRQDCGVLALALDLCEQHIPGYQLTKVERSLDEEMKAVFFDSNAPSKRQLRQQEEEKAAREKLQEEKKEEAIQRHLEKQAAKGPEAKVDLKGVLALMCQECEEDASRQKDRNGRLKKQKKGDAKPAKATVAASKEEPVIQQQEAAAVPSDVANQQEEQLEEKLEEEDDWCPEWITADNITNLMERDMATAEFVGDQDVCVFTLDNAMQNVALQLKLPLIAPSGKQIQRITRYALKCPACCSVYTSMEPIIHYSHNKPFMAQLLNEAYDPRQLFCPSCGSPRLMKVAAYFNGDKVTFSKGIKHFKLQGQQNFCDLTQKQFASLRQKYLLHPELYHDRLVRVRTEKARGGPHSFTDGIQGVSGSVKGDEVAYFLRRGRKGVRFGAGLK